MALQNSSKIFEIFIIYLGIIFYLLVSEPLASNIGVASSGIPSVGSNSDKISETNKTKKTEAEYAKEINRIGKERTVNNTIVFSETQTYYLKNDNRGLLDGSDSFVVIPIVKTVTANFTVAFTLFTLLNPDKAQPLTYTTLPAETFYNTSETSVFLIHGFTQSDAENDPLSAPGVRTSINIRKAFMESNKTENIIIVDWHEASREPNYFKAAQNTWTIGQMVGDFLISLKDRGFLANYSQVYIVGFSLGSHVAAVAGYTVITKTNQRIGRITGLDPAGPSFEASLDLKRRLDTTDADYVDVIHCNAGLLVPYRQLGTLINCGYIDFYPNGGTKQPGCDAKDLGIASCSHLKCPQFYASTVRGIAYPGCACPNITAFEKGECEVCSGPPMGYILPIGSTGIYFLKAQPDPRDNFDGVVELKKRT